MAAKTRTLHENELYRLLVAKLPAYHSETRENRLSCSSLARDLGITNQALNKWFKRTSIPPKQVTALMELPDSRLKLEDILPYVIE